MGVEGAPVRTDDPGEARRREAPGRDPAPLFVMRDSECGGVRDRSLPHRIRDVHLLEHPGGHQPGSASPDEAGAGAGGASTYCSMNLPPKRRMS